jgi:porin
MKSFRQISGARALGLATVLTTALVGASLVSGANAAEGTDAQATTGAATSAGSDATATTGAGAIAGSAAGSADAAAPTGQSITTPGAAETTEAPKAFQYQLDYKGDTLAHVAGGHQKGLNYLGNFDANADFHLTPQTHAYFEFLFSQGPSLSDRVGDVQYASNIEASSGSRIYQAYMEQSFAEDRIALLVGIEDLGSEFYQTDSSGLFLNSSFWVGPELSRTGSGEAQASVYPYPGLAARLKVIPIADWTVRAAVYEGDPERRNLSPDQGVLGMTEISHAHQIGGQAGKLAVGGWTFSQAFDDLSATSPDGVPVQAKNHGAYFLFDQKLYSRVQGEKAGISYFLRTGFSTPEVNSIDQSVETGLSSVGLFPARIDDQLGLAVARAHASSYSIGSPTETSIELTYRAQVKSWLAIQPDLQYIISPAGDPGTPNAVVAGARTELTM